MLTCSRRKHAIGDVLLFIDGDFAIPTSKLKLFLNPILYDQADVVLNNLDALFLKRQNHFYYSMAPNIKCNVRA